ncbi:hypothetical protein SPMU_33040 [Sphingomonas mucosissima]|uniref:Uncharacterized protein n=1 Tax=Sphingomonas mucosissima TaxID=370959 RepID=A0A245ZDN2_9SPHN|nr:hypothetical protein SPMU_33040 [Sphingomonas mucosissima]
MLLQRDGDGIARGRLELPAGAERRVDAQLSPFSNTQAAAAGNAIKLHVPLPGTPRDVTFIAERPSVLPF